MSQVLLKEVFDDAFGPGWDEDAIHGPSLNALYDLFTGGEDFLDIYALLAGRAGGQTLIGGTAAAENLALKGTSHATPGLLDFQSSARLPDNLKMLFGTGSDASIYYTGSRLVIDPHEVGVGDLVLSPNAGANVTMFEGAAEGNTPSLQVSGFRTGDALRTLDIAVGGGAANRVDFTGLTDYYFYGGRLISTGPGTSGELRVGNTTNGVALRGTGAGGIISGFDIGSVGWNPIYIYTGASPAFVYFSTAGDVGLGTNTPSGKLDVEGGDIVLGDESAEGTTYELKVYGYRTGDSLRSLEIGVGVDAADTASFDGLSNYLFDGTIKPVGSVIFQTAATSLDLATNGAYFLPRRLSQEAEPTPATGELLVWYKPTGNRVRLAYNDPDMGVVTVQLI